MTTTLITGANKGLGLETARRLIDAGHTVYAGMRDPADGGEARALGAHVLRLDVTDAASVEAAIADLPELDVLVNNAGILGDLDRPRRPRRGTRWRPSSTPTSSASSGSRRPPCRCCAARRTRSSSTSRPASGGRASCSIPTTTSSRCRAVPYAASKAAVVALTVQYAKNLPGMRVNVSDPGYTATDFNGHSGHQTVTEGTDATVALATLGPDGPTGEFHDRHGRIDY